MEPDARDADSVFAQAIEIASSEERSAFLDAACAADPEFRQAVEKLVRNYFRAGDFLERPAATPGATAGAAGPAERPGTLIGPYKLLEQIGEGGMGLVFVAEQQRPVRRRVALKLIKPGMDSRQVIARFEAERQALALMDHPHIARVFDGGTTERGRPYFVMELVKGAPITDYCDRHRLTPRQRLGLFLDVCAAVQHAHQKGVIHRDLKPSNIMVTVHDVTPVVKVIDFGIAKATGQRLTDGTAYTGLGQMVGTPLYMSPEQAGQSSLDVDTRSDVYSLGVVFYELLTGTTPFDGKMLKRAGYDELRRIIREEEPARPSARLSTLAQAELSTVAERRGADPRKLRQVVRGELDWIVMKCLEKDRNRRYESASALAADIRRYLADEPVQACPPSAGYRLRKFARRHKGGLVAAAGLLAFLAALAGGVGWVVGDRAARQAEAEGLVVEALAVAEAKLPLGNPHDPDLVTAARKAEAQLASGVVRPDLRRQVEQVLADLAMLDRLEQVRLKRAETLKGFFFDTVGAIAGYAQAFRDYGLDVEAAGAAAGKWIRARSIRVELAAALDDWAMLSRLNKGPADGTWKSLLAIGRAADDDPLRTQLRQALEAEDKTRLEQLAGAVPATGLPAATLVLLTQALQEVGLSGRALTLLRAGQQRSPGDFWINHELAQLLERATPPRWPEAARFYTAAVAIRPHSPGAHVNLGNVLDKHGRPDEAVAAFRKAIELKPDYASAYLGLGVVLAEGKRLDDAEAAYRRAIQVKPDYAEAYNNLGLVLRAKGRTDEAIASYRTAIGLKKDLSQAHFNLGYALHNQGREDEAMASYRTAVRLGTKHAWAYLKLGTFVASKGQMEEAIPLFQAAIRLARGPAGLEDADLALTHEYLGAALGMRDKWEEALPALREAVRIKPQSVRARSYLGQGLSVTGRAEEAGAAFREALRLAPNDAVVINNYAWYLATCPDGKFRDARRAVELAGKAVAATPKQGAKWQTLGVARYRAGQSAEAVTALNKAAELRRGGDATDWFFLAMAHHQLRHADEAGAYFHQAVRWMDQHRPQDEELRRFRAEAAALLGITDDPKAPGKDKPVPQP
jgi:serine/threonine protein kinase/Flp pilus assembly protein TadD